MVILYSFSSFFFLNAARESWLPASFSYMPLLGWCLNYLQDTAAAVLVVVSSLTCCTDTAHSRPAKGSGSWIKWGFYWIFVLTSTPTNRSSYSLLACIASLACECIIASESESRWYVDDPSIPGTPPAEPFDGAFRLEDLLRQKNSTMATITERRRPPIRM